MLIDKIEYVTVKQASEMLNKHPHTIRSWIEIGLLSCKKFAHNKWFIPKDAVEGLKDLK
jgi:DNA-binding transcriptional MerR regulator